MKADIPAAIPASMVSASAGLAFISARMLSPAGTDWYNPFANDEPMKNKIGIATISPTDHLPEAVFGINLQGCFFIDSFIHLRRRTNHLVSRSFHRSSAPLAEKGLSSRFLLSVSDETQPSGARRDGRRHSHTPVMTVLGSWKVCCTSSKNLPACKPSINAWCPCTLNGILILLPSSKYFPHANRGTESSGSNRMGCIILVNDTHGMAVMNNKSSRC